MSFVYCAIKLTCLEGGSELFNFLQFIQGRQEKHFKETQKIFILKKDNWFRYKVHAILRV